MASDLSTHQDFDAHPSSLREVRRFVAEAVAGVADVGDIVLVASELATNVVKHARTDYRVTVDAAGHRTRLEVSDGSSIIPAVEELAGSKRGLRVVEGIADQWGVELTESGKTIWVEFENRAPSPYLR